MGRKSVKRHRASSGSIAARRGRLVALLTPQRLFTPDEAQAALVFLRPVANDLQQAFHAALECHRRLEHAVLDKQVDRLIADQMQAIERLDRALDEIELAGAEVLSCYLCVLAFPILQRGGVGRLTWSLADDRVRLADSSLN